jgi:hypothetical protein
MLKKVPADNRTAEIKKGFVYIIEPLIPDLQLPEAIQPGPSPLHYPAIPAQPLAAVAPSPSDAGLYASSAKLLTLCLRVIRLIRMQFVGPLPRPCSHLLYRFNSIYAANHHPRVVNVSPHMTAATGMPLASTIMWRLTGS